MDGGTGSAVVGGVVGAGKAGFVGSVVAEPAVGLLAAAMTVVSPNTAEAVMPLARMRAPIAACGRRDVRALAGRAAAGRVAVGWCGGGSGAAINGSRPRMARDAARRSRRSWSVIVRLRLVVFLAVVGFLAVVVTAGRS